MSYSHDLIETRSARVKQPYVGHTKKLALPANVLLRWNWLQTVSDRQRVHLDGHHGSIATGNLWCLIQPLIAPHQQHAGLLAAALDGLADRRCRRSGFMVADRVARCVVHQVRGLLYGEPVPAHDLPLPAAAAQREGGCL